MEKFIVLLSNHSAERLKKRFGLKRSAALRLCCDVVNKGTIISHLSDARIRYELNGHTYIFAKIIDDVTCKDALIMVTACNEDKSSEWTHYVHGKECRFTATKRSKIQRGSPVTKKRVEPKYKHPLKSYYEECA